MARAARTRPSAPDPTVYPIEDDVGEDSLQRFIAEVFRPLVAALLASRGIKAFAGADQFIYWKQFSPTKCIAPDVYVLPGVAPTARVRAWKVWETGIVPSFALEIMSADDQKDVEASPRRCDELGVRELVVFDPEPETRQDGVRFRVFRRVGKRGLVLVEVSNGDRVRSKVLDCWLRATGEGSETRLRIGLGPRGGTLMPTDQERAGIDADRADRAEGELRKLRAQLAAVRQPRSRRR